MIPKQIFFIWLGDNKPNYVDFAINAFKEVNPSFKIIHLHYKKIDIENIGKSKRYTKNDYDISLYNSIHFILKQINDKDPSLKNNPRKFIQLLANAYRHGLLRKYGGFYIDCDCFPLRPFDDVFDKIDNFKILQTFDDRIIKTDNHFYGQVPNFNLSKYGYNINYLFPPVYVKEKHLERRKLFQQLRLKFNSMDYTTLLLQNKNIYVEHFDLGNWKTHPELCEECCYDELLKECFK